MRAAPLAIVGLLLASGCAAPDGEPTAACPEDRPFGRVLKAWPHSFNAGQASDFLYYGSSGEVGPTTLGVRVTDGSAEERGYGEGEDLPFEDVRFTPPLGTTHFGAFRLSSDAMAQGGVASLFLRDPQRRPECDDRAGGLVSDWRAIGAAGREAQPGKGAHVWYAGFWENGTMLGTNLQDLDVGSGWPRAATYRHVPWEPLRLYVYGRDPSERPVAWTDPLAGEPEPGSPADQGAGSGYATAIPGVNEALKGLPAGSRIVVRLAPEEAFTRPGFEGHPLYGDALVFLIEAEDVVDTPALRPTDSPGSPQARAR